MKQLEINEEQKVKLLEMCKVLFPEYINTEIINLDHEDDLIGLAFLTKECFEINKKFETAHPNEDYDFEIYDLSIGEYDFKIHWFEFCMTHLVDKIYYPDGNGKRDTRGNVEHFMFQSFLYKIEDAIDDTIHPVDYLYTEFKKLEL